MKQFTMPLDIETQRPITYLNDWNGIRAMIDTGALFPVWVSGERFLVKMGAEQIRSDISFSGFGGSTTGSLYRLPMFKFGELIYPGFNVIFHKMEVPCQIILPATMFKNLRYEIDDENHSLNVTIPEGQSNVRNLIIKDRGGKLHVLCSSADVRFEPGSGAGE